MGCARSRDSLLLLSGRGEESGLASVVFEVEVEDEVEVEATASRGVGVVVVDVPSVGDVA